MVTLLHKVEQQVCEQLQQAAVLPADVRVRFDPAGEVSWMPGPHVPTVPHGSVQKTARRTVISLEHGRFQACETVRQAAGAGGDENRSIPNGTS